VLNSGSIKLPYVQGSSKYTDDLAEKYIDGNGFNTLDSSGLLNEFKFTFDIKAPLLVFIEGFQRSKLGALTLLDDLDHQIGYLPQQYFDITSTIMDAKACNDYNTKLNNYYNWAFNFYNKLIENGMNKSQAALVLPQGVFKTFLFEINAKDLITFIEQNHSKSPEMAGYCDTLVLYMEDHLPNVTRWLKANKWNNLF
jgi:hypothetical protein